VDKSSSSFQITDDISRAETLPVDVYGDLAWYECANFIPYANLQLGVGKSKDDSFAEMHIVHAASSRSRDDR